ncbi:TPA: N-6 DNA methylase [Vibrio cholerae]
MNIKNRGAFYTPKVISEWLTDRVKKYSFEKERNVINVLEPSCGDGAFIKAIESSFQCGDYHLDAIEIEPLVLDSLRIGNTDFISLINDDFLFWETSKKYDLVIGNPPYIARKRLNKEQTQKCKSIHVENGLANKEISNIWTSFVIKSSSVLSEKGILAFVLPTELLQVNYAKEIRKYLLDEFHRLEIISFKSLAFEDIEQDTVILIAYKNINLEGGLFFSEVSDTKQLSHQNLNFLCHHGDHNAKWSSYILTEDEMKFVDEIARKCNKISHYCKSVAGIVTAANSFFILTSDEVKSLNLDKYTKRIVKKGMLVNGKIEITPQMFDEISISGKPCYLMDLNGIPESEFSKELQNYLLSGVDFGIPDRYKCKLRERWFDVPTIWKSEGVFFKRGHLHPKLMVNRAEVYVTDSAYRIKMNDGYDIESLVYSFYNSLTLLFSELNGRYYGGGVLELTPNEFKGLPIPYLKVNKKDFLSLSKKFSNKKCIEEIIKDNNKVLLLSIEGLTANELEVIHDLYIKVKQRRLRIS